MGFVIEGEVGVTDPEYGESVVAVDDFSLTNSACPRVCFFLGGGGGSLGVLLSV